MWDVGCSTRGGVGTVSYAAVDRRGQEDMDRADDGSLFAILRKILSQRDDVAWKLPDT